MSLFKTVNRVEIAELRAILPTAPASLVDCTVGNIVELFLQALSATVQLASLRQCLDFHAFLIYLARPAT
jgi:hypothetical protein